MKVLSNIDMEGNAVADLPTPSADSDAANKGYVSPALTHASGDGSDHSDVAQNTSDIAIRVPELCVYNNTESPNTTLYPMLLSNNSTGNPLDSSIFFYYWTTHYNVISSTSNRVQVAMRYSNGDMYVRVYYGSWQSWRKIHDDTNEGDPGWTDVSSFSNSWENHSTTFNAAAYKKIGNQVFLRGLIKSGTVGSVAFTLPSGYLPVRRQLFGTVANDGSTIIARTDVTSYGEVIPHTGGNSWFSLDGLSFFTD